MRQVVFGIDPGITGAIACLIDDELVSVHDLPTRARLYGTGLQLDGGALLSMLFDLRQGLPAKAFLEAVAARPGQGVKSVFSFGHMQGSIEGILQGAGMPYQLVPPATWKKRAGLVGKDKGASRSLAGQIFPTHADSFRRVKDDGRAEAALIAKFAQ